MCLKRKTGVLVPCHPSQTLPTGVASLLPSIKCQFGRLPPAHYYSFLFNFLSTLTFGTSLLYSVSLTSPGPQVAFITSWGKQPGTREKCAGMYLNTPSPFDRNPRTVPSNMDTKKADNHLFLLVSLQDNNAAYLIQI